MSALGHSLGLDDVCFTPRADIDGYVFQTQQGTHTDWRFGGNSGARTIS
jgi:hypothetical protein